MNFPTNTHRPGLPYEIFAFLTKLHCNAVAAELLSRNAKEETVVHVTNDFSDEVVVASIRMVGLRHIGWTSVKI